MITFLDAFDCARFIVGLLVAETMLAYNSSSRRNKFWLRFFVGLIVGIAVSEVYLLIQLWYYKSGSILILTFVGGLWWVFLTFISGFFLRFCFKIGYCAALYNTILGTLFQQIATIFVRYWLVRTVAPTFPEKYPSLYIATTIAVYAVIYALIYFLILRHIKDNAGSYYIIETKNSFFYYCLMICILSLISSLCGGVLDIVAVKLADNPQFKDTGLILMYFCIGVSLLCCIALIVFNVQFLQLNNMRREKQFQQSVIAEKYRQYEISRSSIDIINRRCHDLKHLLNALRFADDSEKNKLFDETQRAINIYGSEVQTDNEVLNVLLTEKSLYCVDRNIRLSCSINTNGIDKISVIDLYTMLGNAIENAIESVEKTIDQDKRTISINIDNQGGLLVFRIQNYYEGNVDIVDGIPKTSKKDKENHGIGLRSIRFIAEKYDGTMSIDKENGVFTLCIIIPTNQPN